MSETVVAVESYGVWVPVIAALSGVFVAGVLNIITGFILDWCRRRSERKSLRLALGAEINSIVTVIQARGYEGSLNNIIKYMQENNIPKYKFHVKIADNFAPIFNANADKIGLLKPGEAAFIVGFHQILLSIVQDITPGGVIYGGADADSFGELLGMLESALEIGEKICKHIKIPNKLD